MSFHVVLPRDSLIYRSYVVKRALRVFWFFQVMCTLLRVRKRITRDKSTCGQINKSFDIVTSLSANPHLNQKKSLYSITYPRVHKRLCYTSIMCPTDACKNAFHVRLFNTIKVLRVRRVNIIALRKVQTFKHVVRVLKVAVWVGCVKQK